MAGTSELPQAIARLEDALRLQPRDGIARAQLAEALRNAGLLQRAEAEARLAVKDAPQTGYTHHVLGLVLADLGQLELSEKALDSAARLSPDDAGVWNNLGRTRWTSGRVSAAIEAYRRAVERAPENPLFHSNLARALVEIGQHDESVLHYLHATRLAPSDAQSWYHLGQVYDEIGRAAEAESCLRKALGCEPRLSSAYVHLLVHHEHSVTDADRSACEALLESGQLDGLQESDLLFALAQAADRNGAFQKAAALLQSANRARKRWNQSAVDPYDPHGYELEVDRVITTFTAEFLAARADWGVATDVPVFVFGLPRSGTTLTERFLAAHPAVHGAGELLLAARSFTSVTSSAEVGNAAADRLRQLPAADIQAIARTYLARLQQLDPQAARIVDKMPENYLYAGWLALLFPRARFVCCMRDFRDVALSAMITSFRYVQWSSDEEQLLHRFRQFRRLHDHWQGVLAGRMMTVHYRELVESTEATARTLVAWVGLPWDDACLDHRASDGSIRTASLSQARKPVYRNSVDRWRNYEPYMGDLFEKVAAIDPVGH